MIFIIEHNGRDKIRRLGRMFIGLIFLNCVSLPALAGEVQCKDGSNQPLKNGPPFCAENGGIIGIKGRTRSSNQINSTQAIQSPQMFGGRQVKCGDGSTQNFSKGPPYCDSKGGIVGVTGVNSIPSNSNKINAAPKSTTISKYEKNKVICRDGSNQSIRNGPPYCSENGGIAGVTGKIPQAPALAAWPSSGSFGWEEILLIALGATAALAPSPFATASPQQLGPAVVGSTPTGFGTTAIPLRQGVTYREYGDVIYGSDGTSYRIFGDTAIGSDGSSSRVVGSTTYIESPTGQFSSYRQVGGTTYGSDGSTARRVGDNIYFTNSYGKSITCRKVISVLQCN